MSFIAENLQYVRERVAAASQLSGVDAELMVVSKTWPSEVVAEAVDAGQLIFGENKLQEGEVKVPSLPSHLEWHFIGGLQRNKVRKVLSLFSVVHSVSSLRLAGFMNRVAGELECRPDVFLEVNIGEEDTKGGFLPDELRKSWDEILECSGLSVQGLMCIPPRVSDAEEARPWFAAVRELQQELRTRGGVELPKLSMGMSGDYEVAIEEGASIVRVGSAIFGPRLRK